MSDLTNLRHYSDVAAIVAGSRIPPQDRPSTKPRGFWVSDESDETSWSAWCRDNEYGIGRNEFVVTLADDANLLILSTPRAVRDFDREFGCGDDYRFDWAPVADRWQGIFISPYQWSLRLSDVGWYYTWDCASGCIWDPAAIASVVPSKASVSA